MIESLSIRNFKVLRDVDVNLQPLTVIVGPNASGKTSVLQALEIISARLNETFNTVSVPLWDPNFFSSRNSAGSTRIDCQAKLADKTASFSLDLIEGEMTHTGDRIKWNHAFLNLSAKRLAAPSYPKSTSLKLPSDGDGLPSILAGLQLEEHDKFSNIVSQIKSVVPSVINIRIRQTQIEK